ncbi:aldo/keto reductase [Ectothiorhodospiraceae bacterium 2226]|nr:aldo/keto reductase [Ectothiorhodospiraceae bacterium 2226]
MKDWRCTRRALLKGAAGVVGLGAVGALGVSGAASAAAAPSPHARPIGRAGERVPVIGLGTYRTFDLAAGDPANADRAQVLERFVALGGRVIDSSPMYGEAEGAVGRLAGQVGVADRLFYATKVWTQGAQAGVRQMEASARLMGAPVIDLMQIHNLLDWQTHLETLYEWKAAGRIRYIGITHYTNTALDDLARIIEREDIDSVQLAYNIANREPERRLLPLAREKGVAVLVNRPFQQGALFRATRGSDLPGWASECDCDTWAQVFLKFIVSHPAVTVALPATSRLRHLEDNMQASFGRLPDEPLRERMAAHLATL